MQKPIISIGRKRAGEIAPETRTDPVCKMLVSAETAAGSYEYSGEIYYFCAVGCKDRFVNDPDKYLRPQEPKDQPRDVESGDLQTQLELEISK